MSHSKFVKRGYSLYLESWNPSAKRFINTCAICGGKGYSPAVEEEDFCSSLERHGIHSELTKILRKMSLDSFGRCTDCARIQDRFMQEK